MRFFYLFFFFFFFFFFNDTATTEIYTLSLHDAPRSPPPATASSPTSPTTPTCPNSSPTPRPASRDRKSTRLNSSHVRISYAVFCLKKKSRLNRRHDDAGDDRNTGSAVERFLVGSTVVSLMQVFFF